MRILMRLSGGARREYTGEVGRAPLEGGGHRREPAVLLRPRFGAGGLGQGTGALGSVSVVLAGLLTVAAAGVVSGVTGFGLSLVATPLLLLILPPRTVVPMMLVHGSLNNLMILLESGRSADLRRIWPLMLTGLLGVPLGAYLLVVCDVDALKALIGAAVALSALAFLAGLKVRVTRERLVSAPVGFVSGLLNGSTGMSGPPVILFFANQGMEKRVFRASLAAYFMALNLATIPAYAVGGLFTRQVLGYAALFAPALALGVLAGMRLALRVEEGLFRRVTLVVVLGTGLLAVATGLRLV